MSSRTRNIYTALSCTKKNDCAWLWSGRTRCVVADWALSAVTVNEAPTRGARHRTAGCVWAAPGPYGACERRRGSPQSTPMEVTTTPLGTSRRDESRGWSLHGRGSTQRHSDGDGIQKIGVVESYISWHVILPAPRAMDAPPAPEPSRFDPLPSGAARRGSRWHTSADDGGVAPV